MPKHTGASPPTSAAHRGFDIFEEVRRRVDIFDVARRLGIEIKRIQGRCPYPDHVDENPSFTLYRDSQSWICYGCGRSGDATNLMRDFGGYVSNFAAAEALLGGSYVALASRSAAIRSSSAKRRKTAADPRVLAVAARHYHELLLGPFGWEGWNYLMSRGVSAALIDGLALGYGEGDGLRAALRRAGFADGEALSGGLFLRDENGVIAGERFAGCVIVPDWDARGGCHWLTGRVILSGDGVRFQSLPGSRSLLGAGYLAGAEIGELFVVEGVFDYLALRQWGYPVVCLCGSPRITEAAAAIDGLGPGVVAFALDADEAGNKGAEALSNAIAAPSVRLRLPDGAGDPADLLAVKGGAEAFATCVADALSAGLVAA